MTIRLTTVPRLLQFAERRDMANEPELARLSGLTAEGAMTLGGDDIETGAFLAIVTALRRVPQGSHGRLVEAALTLLGGAPPRPVPAPTVHGAAQSPAPLGEPAEMPRRASVWLAQANLSAADLDSIFHQGGGSVELIAHNVPGRSKKEQTRGCYLLAGLRGLLKAGEPRFADEDARTICQDFGCYDRANHATYVKSLGNLITGSKSTSYELTQPGLRAAAELIRDMQIME